MENLTMETPEECHMLWIGPEKNLLPFHILCIQSFVKHNFIVNFWSFEKIRIPGTIPRDLNEFESLEDFQISYLSDYDLNEEYLKRVALSDLLRILIIKKYGGWYFDCDCLNLKNESFYKKLRENKNEVLSYDNPIGDNVVINGCYFASKESASKIYEIFCNNNLGEQKKLIWGEIGPKLFTQFAKENNIIPLSNQVFLPLPWKDYSLFIDPKKFKEALRLTKNSYQIHLYSSQISHRQLTPNNLESGSFLQYIITR